jgi:uncharacterized protein (DUF433 family)
MSIHERIEMNVEVMLGKPVIRGARVTVEQILRECAVGLSAEEIADQYPRVTADDVRAALAFAADYLGREVAVAAE